MNINIQQPIDTVKHPNFFQMRIRPIDPKPPLVSYDAKSSQVLTVDTPGTWDISK